MFAHGCSSWALKMDIATLMFFSPPVAVPLCGLVFWLAVRRFGLNAREALDELAGYLFLWLVIGFVVGIALPICLFFLYSSQDAPFMVFLSVPLGVSVGALIATIGWRIHAGAA